MWVRITKVRFREGGDLVVLMVGFVRVAVEVEVMVRFGVFSMSELGEAWAELALEEVVIFSSFSTVPAGVLVWWRTPPAIENG